MSFGVGRDNPTNPTNPNNSLSLGGSSDFSEGSSWQDPSTVWGPQAGYLQGLYGMGNQLMNNFQPFMQAGQGIFDTAVGGYNQLMNPGVNPQLQAYQGEVQRNLERNLLPTIQGQAGGFGQMGSSRQGIAEGLALSDANQQITDMSANLYNQDMDRMMTTMMASPALANFGMSLPWFAMNQFAGLLGDPTVLSGGGGSSQSGGGESWNYGRDIGGGGGGGGGGWNFNIGGPGEVKPKP